MIATNFENVNCLICHSNNSTILYSFNNCNIPLNIVRCECSFVYLNPRPTIDHIFKFYNEDYLPHTRNQLLKFFQKFTYCWKKYIIKKYSSKKNIILDIGAGNASFETYMSSYGYSIDSYDKYNNKSLSSIPDDKIYDIVTFWHSLEHFHDINKIFNMLTKVTHDKTVFIIALPNFNSIDRKIFKDKWVAFDVPRHLYHFTSHSLCKYLEKYNISIIKKHRMIQDTFFNIYLSLNINFFIKILLTPIIVLFSLIFILLNINYTSSLLFICKKDS